MGQKIQWSLDTKKVAHNPYKNTDPVVLDTIKVAHNPYKNTDPVVFRH